MEDCFCQPAHIETWSENIHSQKLQLIQRSPGDGMALWSGPALHSTLPLVVYLSEPLNPYFIVYHGSSGQLTSCTWTNAFFSNHSINPVFGGLCQDNEFYHGREFTYE